MGRRYVFFLHSRNKDNPTLVRLPSISSPICMGNQEASVLAFAFSSLFGSPCFMRTGQILINSMKSSILLRQKGVHPLNLVFLPWNAHGTWYHRPLYLGNDHAAACGCQPHLISVLVSRRIRHYSAGLRNVPVLGLSPFYLLVKVYPLCLLFLQRSDGS